MRDLASRLRAIVRTPVSPTAGADGTRELTYVPDVGAWAQTIDAEYVADRLGGRVEIGKGGSFVAIDRTWDASDYHGRRPVESYALAAGAPIALFDPRLGRVADWADRVVFFDIETTGLSGGAGTIAFLVGCGWFEHGGFRVRQFLLTGPAGEPALLEALTGIFAEASLLVTYNGRTFDVPTMETRWAFHRQGSPADDLPHFDMLPPARRLWGRPARRGAGLAAVRSAEGACTLSALERSVLGFHRLGDVPGFEIPVRYFHFLRSGDPGAVADVLTHNQHDLMSLAAVTAHALTLAADGPEACRDAREQAALGRLYERAGDGSRAERAYALAADRGDAETAAHALARLAVLHRRENRHEAAREAWERVAELTRSNDGLAGLGRRAVEALAIHHEHRARDLVRARGYAAALEGQTSGREADEARHRLRRLDKKMHGVSDLFKDNPT